jgi:ATP-dependent Lon protease
VTESLDRPLTPAAEPGRIPVLPLRDVVVYPQMVIPLFVGRERRSSRSTRR